MSSHPPTKPKHKEWRREAKKKRRKKIRQKVAQERDRVAKEELERRLKDPEYLAKQHHQKSLDLVREQREEHEHQLQFEAWLERERQEEAKNLEARRRQEAIDRALEEQKEKLRKEAEEEQQRLAEVRAKRQEKIEEARRQREVLERKIQKYLDEGGSVPKELLETVDTNPGQPNCDFYSKTGVCRYGTRCCRNHMIRKLSKVLLIENFFTHIQMDQRRRTEYDSEEAPLNYCDDELINAFKETYHDVYPEFQKFGQIDQFVICRNTSPHLRGNLYVEFGNLRDAFKAYQTMHGRFYAGKRLQVQFVSISTWPEAVCAWRPLNAPKVTLKSKSFDSSGMSWSKQCPKGDKCNLMHVFRNPTRVNKLYETIREYHKMWKGLYRPTNSDNNQNRTWDDDMPSTHHDNWRWSKTPERSPSHTSRSPPRTKRRRRSKSPDRRRLKTGKSTKRGS